MASAGQTFAIDVSRWVEKSKASLDLAMQKICLEMFTRVIMRSPVDTGRFRGNWSATVGMPALSATDQLDPSGAKATAMATRVSMQLKAGDRAFLVNNLPYALPLEYGHSKQAPAGMVRITVAEFQTIVRKAAGGIRK